MKESLAQAYTACQWARQAGRECDPPAYAIGVLGEPYRASWRAGWAEEDAKHPKVEVKKR